MKLTSLTSLVALTLALISACSDGRDVSEQAKNPVHLSTTSTANQTQSSQKPTNREPQSTSGIVKSARVAGGYSYIETDINGELFWIATAATSVQPGEKIMWNSHAIMNNFTSKALGKTFDQVLFVDRISTSASLASGQHSGTVLETLNAAGYSYILAQEANKKTWLAVPQMVIDVGQKITWTAGQPMLNFSSRSLNRTFNEIFFVNSVQVKKS